MITVAQLITQLQTLRGELPVQVVQIKTGTLASVKAVQQFTFADIELCEDDGDIETVLLYI